RDEDSRVAGDGGDDAADARLDLPVPVHVRVVEHDVAPVADPAGRVRLALAEDVDDPALQVLGPRTLRQVVEAGAADRLPDAVRVERVLHHTVPDPEAAADAAHVA